MEHKPVVIIGGGFAGVFTAKHLLSRRVPVVLISETNHFTFTPLLHEVATGALISHDATFEYEHFFHDKPFRFIRGRVTSIDREQKQVLIGDKKLGYDFLVIATGSVTNFYSVKGVEHAFVLKNIDDAIALKRAILTRAQDMDRHVSVSVVGGGPTGLELVFDIDRMLRALKKKDPQADYDLRLIHATDIFCRGGGDVVQKYISQALQKAGIDVLCGVSAQGVTPSEVQTTAGSFHSDVTIMCAGVKPNTDVFADTLLLDERGHIPVYQTLQSLQDPTIFALGDVISINNEPTPKLAQTAVREASILAENIARLRQSPDSQLKVYRPKVLGMLFSLGYGDGVGTIGPVIVKGFLAWYLWRTIYLFKTPGLSNKLRVAFSWTMDLFQGRNLTEF
ncbi:FAD-dependent oxidoreductase [Candidatus Uhrbacteria bacterium]|nr:FAD-dependent oxidoreductase [Candidatus Uhrbacteria bacterium]